MCIRDSPQAKQAGEVSQRRKNSVLFLGGCSCENNYQPRLRARRRMNLILLERVGEDMKKKFQLVDLDCASSVSYTHLDVYKRQDKKGVRSMKQYPLNPVDFYEDFLSFLRGIEKYGDKPAITTYTSEKEAVTRSYRQLTEDVLSLIHI